MLLLNHMNKIYNSLSWNQDETVAKVRDEETNALVIQFNNNLGKVYLVMVYY